MDKLIESTKSKFTNSGKFYSEFMDSITNYYLSYNEFLSTLTILQKYTLMHFILCMILYLNLYSLIGTLFQKFKI